MRPPVDDPPTGGRIMTERELLEAITKRCDAAALLWHHCGDGRRCQGPRGLPDLLIVGRRGIIMAELKSRTGETSPDQDLWSWHLWMLTGIRYFLWRPVDLDTGAIDRQLEAIT